MPGWVAAFAQSVSEYLPEPRLPSTLAVRSDTAKRTLNSIEIQPFIPISKCNREILVNQKEIIGNPNRREGDGGAHSVC